MIEMEEMKRENTGVEVQPGFRTAKCGEDEVGLGKSHQAPRLFLFYVNTLGKK